MAYRFKLDELNKKGVRRIAREQIQRAVTELSRDSMTAADVHETRKVVKRLRSLLRMVRPAIPEKVFQRRTKRIGRIGDALAQARDRDILIETIGKLETRFGPECIKTLQPLRPLLTAREPGTPNSKNRINARRALKRANTESAKLENIAFKSRGFEVIAGGIKETYRGARRNFRRAYRRPSDATFHELRKTVQCHWRQMALISRAWPDYFEARITAARQLAAILGDDHDLAILEAEVRKLSPSLSEDAGAIEHLIHVRKDELRSAAYPYAERLFVEKPGDFVRRIRAYWTSAKNMRQMSQVLRTTANRVNGVMQPVPLLPHPPLVAKSHKPRLSLRRA